MIQGTSGIPMNFGEQRPFQLRLFDFRPTTLNIAKRTLYDIPFCLRRLANCIESGREGEVITAVVMIRSRNTKTGFRKLASYQYGAGGRDSGIAMAVELIDDLK